MFEATTRDLKQSGSFNLPQAPSDKIYNEAGPFYKTIEMHLNFAVEIPSHLHWDHSCRESGCSASVNRHQAVHGDVSAG